MTDPAPTSFAPDPAPPPDYAPTPAPFPVPAADRKVTEAEFDAAINAAIKKAERCIARQKAGLPPEESPARAAAGRVPAAARLGGDDGQGGGWTPDRQRAFLGHLAECASVTHACRHVGLSKQSAYALRARTPQSVFAILWDVAVRYGRRRLYDEALERAIAGREVPVWHRGEEVGTRHVHNDRLLMFLLAHEPPAAHPVLDQRQLGELWPALMAEVDAVLPSSLTPDRLADMGVDGAVNGNDRR